MTADNRQLKFTPEEMVRLRECCRGLGTSYADFIRVVVLQALDEYEGLERTLAVRLNHHGRTGTG